MFLTVQSTAPTQFVVATAGANVLVKEVAVFVGVSGPRIAYRAPLRVAADMLSAT
jgi:hypothetical protein